MTLQKISRFFSNVNVCHSSCLWTEARPLGPEHGRIAEPILGISVSCPCCAPTPERACTMWCRAHPAPCTGNQCHLPLCSPICRARASTGELLFLVCKTLCLGICCNANWRGACPAAGPHGKSSGTPPWMTLMPRLLASLTHFPLGSSLPLCLLVFMTSIPLSFCVWCDRIVLFSVPIQRQLPFSRGNVLLLIDSSALLVWLLCLSVGAS